MRCVVSMIVVALLVLGFGFTKPVSADGWEWVPAEPPVTLPDLISKGGQVEGWLAGRASNFIPNMAAETDFTVAGIPISHGGKLYRCITRDGESMGDGSCFVATNK